MECSTNEFETYGNKTNGRLAALLNCLQQTKCKNQAHYTQQFNKYIQAHRQHIATWRWSYIQHTTRCSRCVVLHSLRYWYQCFNDLWLICWLLPVCNQHFRIFKKIFNFVAVLCLCVPVHVFSPALAYLFTRTISPIFWLLVPFIDVMCRHFLSHLSELLVPLCPLYSHHCHHNEFNACYVSQLRWHWITSWRKRNANKKKSIGNLFMVKNRYSDLCN